MDLKKKKYFFTIICSSVAIIAIINGSLTKKKRYDRWHRKTELEKLLKSRSCRESYAFFYFLVLDIHFYDISSPPPFFFARACVCVYIFSARLCLLSRFLFLSSNSVFWLLSVVQRWCARYRLSQMANRWRWSAPISIDLCFLDIFTRTHTHLYTHRTRTDISVTIYIVSI